MILSHRYFKQNVKISHSISAAEPVEENVHGPKSFMPHALPALDDHFYPYGTTAAEPTLSPSIDHSTPTNVTVIKGKSATLACVVRNVGNAAVRQLFSSYLKGLQIIFFRCPSNPCTSSFLKGGQGSPSLSRKIS